MTALWIIGQVLVFGLTVGLIATKLYRKVNKQKEVILLNLSILHGELDEKKKILEDLAQASLGLIQTNEKEGVEAELAKTQELLQGEKGKVTILQAELEAVDIRLRELEEIERELESSSVETAREMELLKAQDRDAEARTAQLAQQIEQLGINADSMTEDIKSNAELVKALSQSKSDLNTALAQLSYLQGEMPTINEKYMALKKAYDALDIEYAQLYEKHQKD